MNAKSTIRRVSGFSIVEVLVALAASLVVVGAVLTFTISALGSNSQTILASRLTQEMRLGMSIMMRELRRAGYDRLAETNVGSGAVSTRYGALNISTDRQCVILSYNRGVNATGVPLAGELKGFRRRVVNGVGVLEADFQSNPPTCDSTSANWIALTNPQQLSVSALSFVPADVVVTAGLPPGVNSITVRQVNITLAANLLVDPDVSRTVTESVRVRADAVAFTPPPPPP